MTRNEFAYKAHENAKDKGFWQERLSNEHCLMLVVTEIAEMVEADRKDKRAKKEEYLKHIAIGVPAHAHSPAGFEAFIKNSVEDEMADIAIRLADLAGALGLDFDNIISRNSNRDFAKFSLTENAIMLVRGLTKPSAIIDKRILFGFNYVFAWAESMNIDLWFFIEQKMKYNALRPALHGKKY